jgi:hypothetical protein
LLSVTSKPKIIARRPAGPDHAVVSVAGGGFAHRRTPCPECPWRKNVPVGRFPPEAFRLSAKTSYDAAMTMFACHMESPEKPATCAGFLKSYGARHNILVRLALAQEKLDLDTVMSDVPLYATYGEMAEANGVAADDPALALCREPK